MNSFIAAHATHPDASMALALVAAQIDAQRAARSAGFHATLGIAYLTDHFAAQAEALLDELRSRWPGVHWVGGVGVGVIGSGAEYIDTPALTVMLTELPSTQFQVFNGRQPMNEALAHNALVHADGNTPDLAELIEELAQRTQSSYVFGGLPSGRGRAVQIADGVFDGGLSGVAFGADVAMLSRVTQGCQPVGPVRRVTATDRNVVLALDGEPALPLLLEDLGQTLDHPEAALRAMRGTLVGLTEGGTQVLSQGGQFGVDTRVRHLIGIDPGRDGVAIADTVEPGQQLAFCRRDMEAARRDLVRICSEIRDEIEADAPVPAMHGAAGELPASRIAGAIYVSCAGRGGPHFGGPSAEAQIVQHALGDVPLVGFFAGGEIAHHHLYGYTGVLTVFVRS